MTTPMTTPIVPQDHDFYPGMFGAGVAVDLCADCGKMNTGRLCFVQVWCGNYWEPPEHDDVFLCWNCIEKNWENGNLIAGQLY